jgi:hypothetical protein
MTGKKTSNSLQSGLVWVPYIPIETVQSISNSNFTPRLSIKSRYFIRTINLIRKSKIENIFKIKNPTD